MRDNAVEPEAAGSAAAASVEALDRPVTGLINSPVLDEVLDHGGILANGSRGYAVKLVQTALGRVGVVLRGGADGHYGPATRNAVMRFQREHGLVPTGITDRTTLLVLDRTLRALDRGERTEALPAPRPLRGLAASYLETGEDRAAFCAVRDELERIRDVTTTTAPEASYDDLVQVLELLDGLDAERYRNVLRALGATHEANAWAPTLLDLLLALPATVSDDASLRERVCSQLLAKLADDGALADVLQHVSPDSVNRLQGAPSFGLLQVHRAT